MGIPLVGERQLIFGHSTLGGSTKKQNKIKALANLLFSILTLINTTLSKIFLLWSNLFFTAVLRQTIVSKELSTIILVFTNPRH
jgi:hypothetical protein